MSIPGQWKTSNARAQRAEKARAKNYERIDLEALAARVRGDELAASMRGDPAKPQDQ